MEADIKQANASVGPWKLHYKPLLWPIIKDVQELEVSQEAQDPNQVDPHLTEEQQTNTQNSKTSG